MEFFAALRNSDYSSAGMLWNASPSATDLTVDYPLGTTCPRLLASNDAEVDVVFAQEQPDGTEHWYEATYYVSQGSIQSEVKQRVSVITARQLLRVKLGN